MALVQYDVCIYMDHKNLGFHCSGCNLALHAFSAIAVVGDASASVVASDSEVGGTPVASITTGTFFWLV